MDSYEDDERVPCKYGVSCYQRNPQHKIKYKHPPPVTVACQSESKRIKLDDSSSSADKSEKGNFTPANQDSNDEDHISDASPPGSPPPSAKDEVVRSEEPKPQRREQASDDIDKEDILPKSPSNVRDNIKQKFLFAMPDDFYSFWDFCKSISKAKPAEALKEVGLLLVGPYDLLSGSIKVNETNRKQSLFLRHWRYYYDPPEFQTIIKGDDETQFHMGYFRDDPKDMPTFVACNSAAKNGVFSQMAENIFGAVNAFLNEKRKSANPFLKLKIPKLQTSIQKWAKDEGYTLETKTEAMIRRDRKAVTKTFHGLGLVVPYDKKSQVGYRDLMESDANLKRILKRIVESEYEDEKEAHFDKLLPIITCANIANDECDFGTSVELGLDLFSYGGEALENSALQLLSTGYSLLGRNDFVKIAKAHIQCRKKGSQLNMF